MVLIHFNLQNVLFTVINKVISHPTLQQSVVAFSSTLNQIDQ